jgi:hypothetical protein
MHKRAKWMSCYIPHVTKLYHRVTVTRIPPPKSSNNSHLSIRKNKASQLYISVDPPFDFSLSQKRPHRLWGPPSLQQAPGLGPCLKQPRCDVDHSPPYIAEVRNKWSYTSTPPIHLPVVYMTVLSLSKCYLQVVIPTRPVIISASHTISKQYKKTMNRTHI